MTTERNIRHTIIVDDNVDVFNETEVLNAVSTRFQAERGMKVIPNAMGVDRQTISEPCARPGPLHEARRPMIASDLDAPSAGHRVACDDASHFTREYKRLFGEPPLGEVRGVRSAVAPTADL
jgi:hypothetical protein